MRAPCHIDGCRVEVQVAPEAIIAHIRAHHSSNWRVMHQADALEALVGTDDASQVIRDDGPEIGKVIGRREGA